MFWYHTFYDMQYLCVLIWVLCSYCDCFGVGIFCGDGCACGGFGNRVEFPEKVVETKQQIESPNPQAFAPKIVPCAADVPPNNMGSSYITVVQPACIKKVGDIFYVTFAGRCEYDNTDIS